MGAAHEFRKRQIYGLLLAAAVILAVTLVRAHMGGVFPRGWWRLW